MPVDRFYLKKELVSNQEILLEGTEFHHLIHVMRGKQRDKIELVNGMGSLATGYIHSIEKRSAHIHIETLTSQKPPSFELILAQAIPRSNRLDWILEKGTELGMTQIWLFPGSHSEKKSFSEHQLERIEALMIAAMKQSGRVYLPTIQFKPELNKWPELKKHELPYPAFFGDLSASAPLFESIWKNSPPQYGSIFFIGPESGFNKLEIDSLNALGAAGVNLHQNILRTDTASLVALALMHHWLQTSSTNKNS